VQVQKKAGIFLKGRQKIRKVLLKGGG
jgi:hypothetical protein